MYHVPRIVLDELDQMWIPVERSWRLNERHYGALQGLNKAETAKRFGNDTGYFFVARKDQPARRIQAMTNTAVAAVRQQKGGDEYAK